MSLIKGVRDRLKMKMNNGALIMHSKMDNRDLP